MTVQSLALLFQTLERETWENLRRLSLSAAGGGLAISFLILQIDGAREPDVFPFDVFSWTWGALLAALFLGLSSYLWRAGGLRWMIRTVAELDPETELQVRGGMRWPTFVERTSVVLSVVAISVAFTLLVIAGFSLNEAGPPSPPMATPIP